MAHQSKIFKCPLTIEDEYLKEGITNSYLAEKAKIDLAEFYSLGKNTYNDLIFRDKILTNLRLRIIGNNLRKQ